MRNHGRECRFRFKQFAVSDNVGAMKVGTDGVLLGAWADVSGATRVLDVGTGTGLIALMIAQRRGDASIDAIELDAAAAGEARANCDASPWADRINVITGDFVGFIKNTDEKKWDLIVSNPPFFNTGEASADSRRACARHETGLSFASLIKMSGKALSDNGLLCFISPADREDDIIYHASLNRLHPRQIVRVSTVESRQPSRLLWQLSRHEGPAEVTCMDIRLRSGEYSPRYSALTNDFYLEQTGHIRERGCFLSYR